MTGNRRGGPHTAHADGSMCCTNACACRCTKHNTRVDESTAQVGCLMRQRQRQQRHGPTHVSGSTPVHGGCRRAATCHPPALALLPPCPARHPLEQPLPNAPAVPVQAGLPQVPPEVQEHVALQRGRPQQRAVRVVVGALEGWDHQVLGRGGGSGRPGLSARRAGRRAGLSWTRPATSPRGQWRDGGSTGANSRTHHEMQSYTCGPCRCMNDWVFSDAKSGGVRVTQADRGAPTTGRWARGLHASTLLLGVQLWQLNLRASPPCRTCSRGGRETFLAFTGVRQGEGPVKS